MRPSRANNFALVAAAAGVWAAAELIFGLTVGGFLGSNRAEAVAFLQIRPFLLIAAAALVAPWPGRRRFAFYLAALLAAALGEALLVQRLGAPEPWSEMLRGLAAAMLILVPADLLVQAGRSELRGGGWIAAAVLAGLMLTPTLGASWRAVALVPGDGPPSQDPKPRLLLMTSLPIVWGEYGAFDPRSRPSESYRALQEEFDVRPIDTLDRESFGKIQHLLLAQPRWLSPSELVALDSWVRGGGRVFILADPELSWPSELPMGDVRRPAPINFLEPLLTHWGLSLEGPSRRGRSASWVQASAFQPRRRIVLETPGRVVINHERCGFGSGPLLATCVIGHGRAMLVPDADLLRDDLWTAPGRRGAVRHRRTADNPMAIADLIDVMAQLGRDGQRRPVAWADPAARLAPARFLAFLPALLLLGAALALALLARIRHNFIHRLTKGEQLRNQG